MLTSNLENIIIFLLIAGSFDNNDSITIFEGGGHSIKLCTENIMKVEINNCTNQTKTCEHGSQFLCQIPCRFFHHYIKINRIITKITFLSRPVFELNHVKNHLFKSGDYLNITSRQGNLLLLEMDEIQIIFSKNISCSLFLVSNQSISCKLDIFWAAVGEENVNVSVRFGSECNLPNYLGVIQVQYSTSSRKLLYYLLIICAFISILTIIYVYCLTTRNLIAKTDYQIFFQNQEQENQFVHIQRKAFVEYQKKAQSFKNLGELTPIHLLSFNEYINRNFEVSFKKITRTDKSDVSFHFEKMLLDKFQLMAWITSIEWQCKIEERTLVACYLTIYMFQNPEYFLEVMKTMLIQLIFEMKKNSDERTLFQKPESIAELIVENWLTICMYENFKACEEGQTLFSLYRALKCQINSGLVDEFSNKSQYSLSPSYLLPNNLDYETLNVFVSVNIQIKMMDASINPWTISLINIPIIILSLDTVSQVKAKILDKAIMMYLKGEHSLFTDSENKQTIAESNLDNFLLYFFHNKVKVNLANFDKTSILLPGKKKFIVANTMKHYNIKSDNKLLLTSENLLNFNERHLLTDDKLTKIHLLIPKEAEISTIENKKNSKKKLIFQPAVDKENINSSLFILLTTKKNINDFIHNFFKSLTTDIPCQSNSKVFSSQSSYQINQERKFFHVFYLFSMLEDIATSISINDTEEIKSWKINSFINAFWSKAIRNPNKIFSVEVDSSLFASLNVIAEVLLTSCSQESSILSFKTGSSISTQIFHEDITTTYIHWWNSFLNSKRKIPEEDIVSLMSDIVEKYELEEFKANALEELKIFGHKYLKQV